MRIDSNVVKLDFLDAVNRNIKKGLIVHRLVIKFFLLLEDDIVRVTVYQCKLNAIMRESEKRRSSTLRAMLEDRYNETMSMKEVKSKGIVYWV